MTARSEAVERAARDLLGPVNRLLHNGRWSTVCTEDLDRLRAALALPQEEGRRCECGLPQAECDHWKGAPPPPQPTERCQHLRLIARPGGPRTCMDCGAIWRGANIWDPAAPPQPDAVSPEHGRCRCPDEVVIPFGSDHVWTGNLRHSRRQGCYSMPGGAPAVSPAPAERCPNCSGAGVVQEADDEGTYYPPCHRCDGSGAAGGGG
jgi:hypothetical protein